MILYDYTRDAHRIVVEDVSTTQIICDGVDVSRELFNRGVLVDGHTRYLGTFLEAFAEKVREIVDFESTVAFVADYETTVDSGRRVTIVPTSVGYKRAGRGLLENRVGIDVVIARQTTDVATEAEFARVLAFKLADRNVVLGGIAYLVDDVKTTSGSEQSESNVRSYVISIVYRAIGTV